MKNNGLSFVIGFVIGIILIGAIWWSVDIPPTKPQYWEDANFKTDTVYVDKPYIMKKDTFMKVIPAKVIYKYLLSESSSNNLVIDSLIKVVDSLGKVVNVIDSNFITEYPNSPKLLYALLNHDTLMWDLFKVNGEIERSLYMIDLDHFQYEFFDNRVHVKDFALPQKSSSTIKPKWYSLHIFGGYSLLEKSLVSSLDLGFKFKNLQAVVYTQSTIQSKPTLSLVGKLGYKLW